MRAKEIEILKKNLSPNPGILLKEEYLNTAVLIPLIEIKNEYHFLFEKRSADIRQGGEICFPGGEIDEMNDSSFKETAIRETVEELGIQREKIKIIGELGTLIGPMGITLTAFIGKISISDLNELKIDKTEVEKVFTIPVSFFQKNSPEVYHVRLETHPYYFDEKGEKVILLPVEELKLPAKYANPWGFRKRKVLVYKTGDEVIWGLTANLIYEFVKKLSHK